MLSRYTAAFAQLHNAAVADADAVPDIQDPKQNLAASLARVSQVMTQLTYQPRMTWSLDSAWCLPARFTSTPLQLHKLLLPSHMILQASPGRVGGLVQNSLSPDLQQTLQRYCQSAGVSIA